MKTTLLRRLSRRRRRGMTLLEIIVVITILGMIAAAVAVAVLPTLNKAKVDQAYNDMAEIRKALNIYYARKGSFPETGGGLKALVDQQLLDKLPMDPWGNEYIYYLEAGKPVIKSLGEDKAEGGDSYAADLSSNDTRKP